MVTVRQLEELALNALPALQTTLYDGWLLRFANGYTRRANSVSPLYPASLDLDEKIAVCEQLYAARGLAPVFKLTSAAQPPELDAVLAQRGYRGDAHTSVQTLALRQLPTLNTNPVVLAEKLTDDWCAAFFQLSMVDARYIPTMTQMLRNIAGGPCFALLHHEGIPIAVGLAVLDRGYVGLFDIVTVANARRQGCATALVLQLLHWGQTRGAHHAYLQVMHTNSPAIRLYAKLGFREVYTYWYRVRPEQP